SLLGVPSGPLGLKLGALPHLSGESFGDVLCRDPGLKGETAARATVADPVVYVGVLRPEPLPAVPAGAEDHTLVRPALEPGGLLRVVVPRDGEGDRLDRPDREAAVSDLLDPADLDLDLRVLGLDRFDVLDGVCVHGSSSVPRAPGEPDKNRLLRITASN